MLPSFSPTRLLARFSGSRAVALLGSMLICVGSFVSAQSAAPDHSMAGISAPGTTRYPGSGLRFLDGYSGAPVVGRVGVTIPYPGSGHLIAILGRTPAEYVWLDASDPAQAPQLVSQGTIVGLSGDAVRLGVVDATRSCLYVAQSDGTYGVVKYVLNGIGDAPQYIGSVSVPVGVAAMALDEGAGELVLVRRDGHLAKYAVGDNSSLPTLVGSEKLPQTNGIPASASMRTNLLIDGASRNCLVVDGPWFYVCSLGEPGTAPTTGTRTAFEGANIASSATWIEPGVSALLFTAENSNTRFTRMDFSTVGALPEMTHTAYLVGDVVQRDRLVWDSASGRAWHVGLNSQSPPRSTFRRIDPGAPGTPPSVEDEWAPEDLLVSYDTSPYLADRFQLMDGYREAFFLNEYQDYLFGSGGRCEVSTVSLDTPSGSPLGVKSIMFGSASSTVRALANDGTTGYNYAVSTWPTIALVKFTSGEAGGPIQVASQMEIPASQSVVIGFEVAQGMGLGYLLSSSGFAKIDLGSGDASPSVIDELPPLGTGQYPLGRLIQDVENGYGYQVYYSSPAPSAHYLRKVRLGGPSEPMEEVVTMQLPYNIVLLGFDQENNNLLVQGPGFDVGLIDAGAGDSTPVIGPSTSSGSFPIYTTGFESSFFDPSTRILQLGTNRYTPPPRPYGYGTNYDENNLVRMAIPEDGSAPTLISNLEMGKDLGGLQNMAGSSRDGKAWGVPLFGNRILEFDLNDTETTSTISIEIPGPNSILMTSAAYDDDAGIVMFASNSTRGRQTTFVRAATRPDLRGALRGTRFHLDAVTRLTYVNIWSHAALGNARLSIHSDAAPLALLWDSGVVPITANEAALTVPISAGSPNDLVLEAGDYWLCWQIDTAAGVPSHSPGTPGDSFELPLPFGAPSDTISPSDLTPTPDLWTAWVTLQSSSSAGGWALYE